ncbi:MAG TPA: hypothetical protein ENK66_02665 [Arcobacter sp.]|nr:hypothetical protein [Arcobacter sp.]
MKKTIGKSLLVATLLLTASSSFAKADKDKMGRKDIGDIEKFFYNQGVKEGYNEAYAAGYTKAIKDAIMALERYKTLIEAREAGKYLSEENKISYPEVYSVKKNGGMQIKIHGCKIEKELSISDILKIPVINAEALSDGEFDAYEASADKNDEEKVSNSIEIVKRDRAKSEKPMLPGNETQRARRFYNNTPTVRKALDINNVAYSVDDNKVKALFSSKESADLFESEYHIK